MGLDAHHKRQDMRMLERAVRARWDIPDDVFEKWPDEIVAIVKNKSAPLRERLRAMELMAKLHGQNLGQAEVVQQTLVNVNTSAPAVEVDVAQQVREMDATIVPPHLLLQPPKPNGNGHHKNGNGKPR